MGEWWNIFNSILLLAVLILLYRRTGPNHFIDTLAGMALRLKEVEDNQRQVLETEERIREYVGQFHQARLTAEQRMNGGLELAMGELTNIKDIAEKIALEVPQLEARFSVIAAWQNGFDARMRQEIVKEKEKD